MSKEERGSYESFKSLPEKSENSPGASSKGGGKEARL